MTKITSSEEIPEEYKEGYVPEIGEYFKWDKQPDALLYRGYNFPGSPVEFCDVLSDEGSNFSMHESSFANKGRDGEFSPVKAVHISYKV